MPMYNLIEKSDNYSKTSRGLWQYYSDESSLNNNNNNNNNNNVYNNHNNIVDFTGANHNSRSFKYNQKIRGQTGNEG